MLDVYKGEAPERKKSRFLIQDYEFDAYFEQWQFQPGELFPIRQVLYPILQVAKPVQELHNMTKL